MTFEFASTAGGVRITVPERELAVLRAVPGFLATTGETQPHVVARGRHSPSVYGDDEAADREFHRLSGTNVDEAQQEDRLMLEVVLDRLGTGEAELTVGEASAMVRAVGSARIALAANHGLFELDELPAEPESPQQMLVAFLGMIQEDLVGALTEHTTGDR